MLTPFEMGIVTASGAVGMLFSRRGLLKVDELVSTGMSSGQGRSAIEIPSCQVRILDREAPRNEC
jgi:hypothetical protein